MKKKANLGDMFLDVPVKKLQPKVKLSFEEKCVMAEAKYEARIYKHVMKLARSYFYPRFRERQIKAMKRTMRMTQFSRSVRMSMSYSVEYMGFAKEEMLPSHDYNYDHVKECFAMMHLDSELENWIAEAEFKVNRPKILQQRDDLANLEIIETSVLESDAAFEAYKNSYGYKKRTRQPLNFSDFKF